MIAAVDGGYFNIMKLLIKAGAEVDPIHNDKTAINFSSYWNHLYIIKRLNEMVSNAGLNNTYERPLIAACDRGQI